MEAASELMRQQSSAVSRLPATQLRPMEVSIIPQIALRGKWKNPLLHPQDVSIAFNHMSHDPMQALSLGLGERWEKVKDAYAHANRALGDIVKVTPSSKVNSSNSL